MDCQADLLLAIAGSAILTIGVLALCAHFTSALSRERILLWFGLFASPYGIALLCRSAFLPEWDGGADPQIALIVRFVGILSGIPAILLFQEFYGTGWRLATKRLVWIYALSVFVVFVLITLHSRYQQIPSPGIALVILVPLELVAGWIAGYKPPEIKYRFVVFLGLIVFFLTFSYDHLTHLRMNTRDTPTEPLGFLALAMCLGFVVFRRVVSNEVELRSLTNEMQAARRIQAAILPSSMPSAAGFSVAARYSPMTAVAGDYYSFPTSLPGRMSAIVADVMGHGVPAALVASMIKVSVLASAERLERPVEIIRDLNRTLCRAAPNQLATAIYVTMNRSAGIGWYSVAGHPPPLIWRRTTQRLEPLDAEGLLLGIRSEESFPDQEFRFSEGDRLLLYSDGLTEAENQAGISFGDARLPDFMKESQSLDTECFASKLLKEVLYWSAKGSEPAQADDITFVVIDLQ